MMPSATELEQLINGGLARLSPTPPRPVQVRAIADDTVEISASKTDLEKLILDIAKHEAGKHGVTLDDVQLTMTPLGPRAFQTEINLKAHKLFFSTTVRISGTAEVDAGLGLKLFALVCQGEGAIGSVACGFLSPQLQKLEGRSFPLADLSLGETRLRDVSVELGDQIKITAVC